MTHQPILRKIVVGLLAVAMLSTAVGLVNVQGMLAAPLTKANLAPLIHIVQAGDTLSSIAAEYGTSVQALINLNHLHSTVIEVGQEIIILTESIPGSGIGTIYTVVRGDTLSVLAWRFNTTVRSIMIANGLQSTVLEIGQQLAIPRDFALPDVAPAPVEIPAPDSIASYPISYVVQRGDTLSAIARRYDTTVQSLMEVNHLRSTVIYVGQNLIISVATLPDAPMIHYLVEQGDTLSALAHRYAVSVAGIMSANGLTSVTIYVGQQLLIPQSLGYPTEGEASGPKNDESRPLACTAVNPSVTQYDDPEGNFCLVFPERFHLADQAIGRVGIYGPLLDQSMEPAFAAVMIVHEGSANGTLLDDVVNTYLQNNAEGIDVLRQAMTLGGEDAIRVDGLPGRTGSRQLFVVHAGEVYHLTFYPVDPAFSQVSLDVEELWQVVVHSFSFTK